MFPSLLHKPHGASITKKYKQQQAAFIVQSNELTMVPRTLLLYLFSNAGTGSAFITVLKELHSDPQTNPTLNMQKQQRNIEINTAFIRHSPKN